jgi:Family of unknown function (DUF6152)
MRNKLLVAAMASAVTSLLMLAAAPASAHHAFAAEFDGNKPINLHGKVTKVEWINPHTWIHIDAEMPDGTKQAWMIEGGTPNTLLRRGIDRDSLKVGTDIVVRGYQSKDGLCTPICRGNGRDVTFPDGRKLFMGSSGTGAPKDGTDATEK